MALCQLKTAEHIRSESHTLTLTNAWRPILPMANAIHLNQMRQGKLIRDDN